MLSLNGISWIFIIFLLMSPKNRDQKYLVTLSTWKVNLCKDTSPTNLFIWSYVQKTTFLKFGLAPTWPILYHCHEDWLTDPMCFINLIKPKVTGSLVTRLRPEGWLSIQWGLKKEHNTLTHRENLPHADIFSMPILAEIFEKHY